MFDEKDVRLAESFRDQALIAIENARLFNETKEALDRQTATAEILRVIASSPADTQPVFEAIVASAKRLLGARAGVLTRFIGDHTHLAAFTAVNPEHDAAFVAAFPRPAYDPITQALRAGRMVLVDDTESDDDWGWREGAKIGIRSGVNVPLINQGTAIGGLTVNRSEPGAFDHDDVELLRTFADQAVIAIENARLLNETQEARTQQTASAEVLKVISRSAFDLDAVPDTLIESARALCDASQGMLLMRDGPVLKQKGYPEAFERWVLDNPQPPGYHFGVGRASLTGEAVHFPDVEADPDCRLSEGRRLGGYRALLSVPLLRAQEVLGVFSLGRPTPGPFTDRQIELVRTFADQAVFAIQNVRLFEAVQAKTRDLEESLRRQTATAEVLKVISRSAFDLQKVLDTLIGSALTLGGADSGLIYLQRDDAFYVQAHYNPASETAFVEKLRGEPQRPGRTSVGARVLLTGEIQHVPDENLDHARKGRFDAQGPRRYAAYSRAGQDLRHPLVAGSVIKVG